MNDLLDLLTRLEEYMDNKADVINGPYGYQLPNEEMSFLVEIREAIERLKNKQ